MYSSYYFICIKNAWLLINLWLHYRLHQLYFSTPFQDKLYRMHICHTGRGILSKQEHWHSFTEEQQLFPGLVPKAGRQNLSYLANHYVGIVRGSLSVTGWCVWRLRSPLFIVSSLTVLLWDRAWPETLMSWYDYGFTAPGMTGSYLTA